MKKFLFSILFLLSHFIYATEIDRTCNEALYKAETSTSTEEIYEGNCGNNVTWTLNTTSKVLSINGSGEMENFNPEDIPWYNYKDYIETVNISDGVTKIGSFAFCECTNLKNINIPGSVEIIDEGAFANCSGLTSITIPEGVSNISALLFHGCSNLVTVKIPDTVTSIGIGAFFYCSNLVNITIPIGVTSIEQETFVSCSSLTNIIIPNGVTTIKVNSFAACSSLTSIELPSSVTTIENTAFAYCESLASVTMLGDVPTLGENVFAEIKSDATLYHLQEYDYSSWASYFGGGTSSIYGGSCGENATWTLNTANKVLSINGIGEMSDYNYYQTHAPWYNYRNHIETVKIGSGITNIGSYAFYNCSSLTNIEVPNSVTSIRFSAFYECSALESIEIPSSVTSIGLWAFYGCSTLTSIEIPTGVTSIGSYAFSGCSALASIEIPTGVTSIGSYAFNECSALASIEIPSSVTNIEYNAFTYCSVLENIIVDKDNPQYDSRDNCNAIIEKSTNTLISGCKNTIIPNSVTYIGRYAFQNCSTLESIEIPSSVTSIGEWAFSGCSTLTSIVIPNSVTTIASWAFRECGLTSVVIPSSVKYLGKEAFCRCENLEEITIEGTPIMEQGVFSRTAIKEIIIPQGIETIPEYAFDCSPNLQKVTIPASVTTIKGYAFEECQALTKVVSYAVKAPAIEENTFNNISTSAVLKRPIDSDYSAWEEYFSSVEDILVNQLFIKDTLIFNGNQLSTSIKMNNIEPITSLQFDLYLPEGITFVEDEAGEIITLNTGRTSERVHEVSFNKQEDGAMRIICYSKSNKTFTGNNGEIIDIVLNIPQELERGDYKIEIKNIEFVEPDETQHIIPEYEAVIKVVPYIDGDVNGDYKVTIVDVVAVTNNILNIENENFKTDAADLNKDGKVSIVDVTAIINIILGVETNKPDAAPMMAASTTEKPNVRIAPFTLKAGEEKEIYVLMNNKGDAFTALQFDLHLPEGVEICQDEIGYFVERGSRTDRTFGFVAEKQSNGAYIIVGNSSKNNNFKGEEGDIAVITIKGAEDLKAGVKKLEITNIEISRQNATGVNPEDYRASIVVDGEVLSTTVLEGDFTIDAIEELNSVLNENQEITSIDLTGAVAIDNSIEFTTGNPNALLFIAEDMMVANSVNVITGDRCSNLIINDSKAFNTPVDFYADTFEFNRTVEGNKTISFILPAAIPTAAINGEVYYLSGVKDNTLNFCKVTEEYLSANTPYIVVTNESANESAPLIQSLNNVTIEATLGELDITVDNIRHIGSYLTQKVASDNNVSYYGYMAGEFVKANTGTLNPFRTMIVVENDYNAIAKYSIELDGETTAIKDINKDEDSVDVYDLTGRLVMRNCTSLDKLEKGMYIVNGKKIFIE